MAPLSQLFTALTVLILCLGFSPIAEARHYFVGSYAVPSENLNRHSLIEDNFDLPESVRMGKREHTVVVLSVNAIKLCQICQYFSFSTKT